MNENETKEITPAPEKKEAETTIGELAKALKEQKENSVSKEDYEKLKAENTELMRSIIDGSPHSGRNEPEEKPADLHKLAADLREGGIGNLEYCKRALKFRDEYMKKYERDPFAPNNDKMTEEDEEKARNVAEVMKECMEQADGSETMFNALLMERTKNDSASTIASLRKKGLID